MARRDSITVRVSVEERESLESQARNEGRTVGDVARRRLFARVTFATSQPQDKAPQRKTMQDDAPASDKEKARVCAVLGHEWHADGHCLKCGGVR